MAESGPAARSPSASLLGYLAQQLARHPPFAQMDAGAIEYFLSHARERYFAPGEVVVQPSDGPVQQLLYVRQGAVSGVRGLAELPPGAFQYEAGDLFPVGAAMAARPVTATYTAAADTFLLALPAAAMHELAGRSPVFADFLSRRIVQFVELSGRALQVAYASQALAEQSLETPLGQLVRGEPVTCSPGTPVGEALAQMQQRRIGSILVVGASRSLLGILTRYDVLGRVTLAQIPLDTPMRDVMVQPVHSLTAGDTAQDAMLLMSRHGIRHVPITQDHRVVGIVSERDLFALQRLSLKQVSTSLRAAPDVRTLALAAQDIRRFATRLLGQGVQARQLTALISHLNDALAGRLLQLTAQEHGVDLHCLCWLALGSEGRSEQTIATDQDNALILPDGAGTAGRAAALAFGRAVNLALDACGYPLCKGGIMAGEPGCCLTLGEWRTRFTDWIAHGAPQDLLDASIFFDLRPLAGDLGLARGLQAQVLEEAHRTPRFHKQLALNALARTVPLNWLGGIETDAAGTVDLKLQGTAVIVDAARVYALAHGVPETGTRDRLDEVGRRIGLAPSEYQAWSGAFEFLQLLRLRAQLEGTSTGHPNRIAPASLNDIDRRILKESFRIARQLQQRMQLDWDR
jgi:CBS domain-containing protein